MCVHYPKSNPYSQDRPFKMPFFSELCPFFDFDILSSIKHPTAERWPPHAVLLFYSKRFSTGRNSNFYYYFVQLLSKFHETSRLCCLLKVSSRDFFLFMCFCNLTLCHGKMGFLVKFQYLLVSHSVLVKIS